MFFGLVLIVVGAIAILVKLGILTGSIWGYTWPVVLIILGLLLIFGRRRYWVWRHWDYPPDEKDRK